MSEPPRTDSAFAAVRAALDSVRRHPSTIAGALVFIGVLSLWIWRLQRGIDLSDECFYIAAPLRFALGDRPFLDERTSTQGAALLELPLVALYHLFVRSNAGLVLFLRVAYLAFLAAIGIALASAVRGWISRGAALACGALACFYAPYCIFALSYNTLGGGLAILAAVTVLRLARDNALTPKAASRYAMFAGACVAGSALAYPTLIPIAAVHAVTIVFFGRRPLGWWKTLAFYSLGGAAVVLYVSLFVVRSGVGSLKLTLDFIRAYGPSMTKPIASVPETVERFKQDWVYSFAVAAGLTAVARRIRLFVFPLALYVPVLAYPLQAEATIGSMRFFTCLALFAPFFAVLVDDRRRAFQIMATLWFPGIVTGLLAGISSGNGGLASGLGGFASVLAGAILAARACEEAWGPWKAVFGWSSIVAPLAVAVSFGKLVLGENAIYRDASLSALTETVRIGPFKGLRTTAEHRALVEQMHTDIVTYAAGSRYGLFFPDMPSAYLSANTRGGTVESWMGNIFERSRIDAEVFREKAGSVGIVIERFCPGEFWTRCAPQSPGHLMDPLYRAVGESHDVVLKRNDYWILKPR